MVITCALAAATVLGAAARAHAATAPVAGALLPLVHTGTYPGAAVLPGDAKQPKKATPKPSFAASKLDYATLPCFVGPSANTPQFCVISNVAQPTFTVALIGDSMAWQWIYAVRRIVAAHHWRLVVATHSSCPFSAAMPVVPSTGEQYVACHDWSQAVMTALTTQYHPNVVLVGDLPAEGSLHHPHPGPDANRELGEGMAVFWQQLIAAHSVVVGIRETPNGIRGTVTARSLAVQTVTPVLVARTLVAKFAHVVDLDNTICGAKACDSIVGNIRVYRDSHHLTRTYVRTLAPYLERKLMKLNAFKGH